MLAALASALASPGKVRGIEAEGKPLTYFRLIYNFLVALVPFLLVALTLWGVWWYVVIHQQAGADAVPEGLQPLGSAASAPVAPTDKGPSQQFYWWFGGISVVMAAVLVRYYLRMDGDRFEVVKLLTSSVMPLGILTFVVLFVILFGITTATESAGVGAAGAFLLAF